MTKTYSPKLLREIDAAVAEHCFGFKPEQDKSVPRTSEQYCHPHYTTDPAASDALDDKLVEICGEDGYWISKRGDEFQLVACLSGKDAIVRMPTKKLVKSVALLRLMAPNCEALKKI